MAKGNVLLGYGRGAVGDLVFSRLKGQQITKARNRHPNNPKTIAQMAQRIRMPQAVNCYRAFADFLTRAYQNKGFRESDYNSFVSRNIMLVPFLRKSANDMGAVHPGPYRVSSGSFGTRPVLQPFVYGSAANGHYVGAFEDLERIENPKLKDGEYVVSAYSNFSADYGTWKQVRERLNARIGDMITIGFVTPTFSVVEGHDITTINYMFGYYQHIFSEASEDVKFAPTYHGDPTDVFYNTRIDYNAASDFVSSGSLPIVYSTGIPKTFADGQPTSYFGVECMAFGILSRADINGKLVLSDATCYLSTEAQAEYEFERDLDSLNISLQSYGYSGAPLLDPRDIQVTSETRALPARAEVPAGEEVPIQEVPVSRKSRGPKKA